MPFLPSLLKGRTIVVILAGITSQQERKNPFFYQGHSIFLLMVQWDPQEKERKKWFPGFPKKYHKGKYQNTA